MTTRGSFAVAGLVIKDIGQNAIVNQNALYNGEARNFYLRWSETYLPAKDRFFTLRMIVILIVDKVYNKFYA